MTFRVGLKIDGDASGAKAAFGETERAVTKLSGVMAQAQSAWSSFANPSGAIGAIAQLATSGNAAGLALNAAAAAAGAFYGVIASESPRAEDYLKEHDRLLGVIKGSYDRASSSAKFFYDQSRETTKLQLMLQQREVQEQHAAATGKVISGATTYGNIGGFLFSNERQVKAELAPFEDAIFRLHQGFKDGTPDVRGFVDEVSRIGLAGSEATQELAGGLIKSTEDAAKFEKQLRQIGDMLTLLNGGTLSGEQKRGLGLPAGGAAASAEANEYTRAERSLRKKIEAMEAEAVTFNMGAVEAARFKAEQLLLNAAQAAGIKQSPALIASVETYGERAAIAAGKLKELAERRQGIDTLRDGFRSLLSDVKGGFEQGLKPVEAFFSAIEKGASRALDKVLELATNDLFAALGGSRGQGLGSLTALLGFGGGGSGGVGGSSAYMMGGVPVPLFHAGRLPGQAPRAFRFDDPSLYATAPRFHQGRVPGLKPGELRAIIRDDELIIPGDNISRAPGDRTTASVPAVNNFYITTPSPRAFSEDRSSVMRGANRLLSQAARFA